MVMESRKTNALDVAVAVTVVGILVAVVVVDIIGSQGAQRPSIDVLVPMFLFTVIVLCLAKLKWALLILVFLSPAHLVIKEVSPSIVADVWREILLISIVGAWLVRASTSKLHMVPSGALGVLLLAYLVWGVVVIALSSSFLLGFAGFRFMMGVAPVFFVVRSIIDRESDIKRYVKAILASGVIVAGIAIIQFLLVSVLKTVPQGTGIDFARKYAPDSYLAVGVPWDRSNSILIGPNELGMFMSVCLTLSLSYYLSRGKKNRHAWLLGAGIALMGLGLLVSMSRTAMISFVVGAVVVAIAQRKATRFFLLAALPATVLAVTAQGYLVPLFAPIGNLSDPFFSSTIARHLSSGVLTDSFFFGHGFGVTPSVVARLGLEDPNIFVLGGVDIYLVQAIAQIGFVGLLLFGSVWFLFLKKAIEGSRLTTESQLLRDTAIGARGVFVAVLIASVHFAAWEYISFAVGFYVLGAIATRISDVERSERRNLKESENNKVTPWWSE